MRHRVAESMQKLSGVLLQFLPVMCCLLARTVALVRRSDLKMAPLSFTESTVSIRRSPTDSAARLWASSAPSERPERGS